MRPTVLFLMFIGFVSQVKCEHERLKSFMGHSVSAYCNSVTDDAEWNCPTCDSNLQLFSNLGQSLPRTMSRILSEGLAPRGFVATNNKTKEIVVSFRGSSDKWDYFLIDADFSKSDMLFVDYEMPTINMKTIMGMFKSTVRFLHRHKRNTEDFPLEDVQVHRGFLRSYNTGRNDLIDLLNKALDQHPDYSIVFTGHSLGAAFAVLAALDFVTSHDPLAASRVSIITFGQPRIGNTAFANYFDSIKWKEVVRVTRRDDIVTRIPPLSKGYTHAKKELYLLDNHTLKEDCKLSGLAGETIDCSSKDRGVAKAIHTKGYFNYTTRPKLTGPC